MSAVVDKEESILDISAHKYGNYHKYYTFHPAENRMAIIEQYSLFYTLWWKCGTIILVVLTLYQLLEACDCRPTR